MNVISSEPSTVLLHFNGCPTTSFSSSTPSRLLKNRVETVTGRDTRTCSTVRKDLEPKG